MALAGLAMCAIKDNKIDEAQELLDVIKQSYKEDLESTYVKKVNILLLLLIVFCLVLFCIHFLKN